MKRHGEKIGTRYIETFKSSPAEMTAALSARCPWVPSGEMADQANHFHALIHVARAACGYWLMRVSVTGNRFLVADVGGIVRAIVSQRRRRHHRLMVGLSQSWARGLDLPACWWCSDVPRELSPGGLRGLRRHPHARIALLGFRTRCLLVALMFDCLVV